MMSQQWLCLLPLLLTARLLTAVFLENAGQFLQAGFKKYHRLGKLQEDITVLEVSAKLMLMVEDIALIDKKRVTVEIAGGEGDWVVAGGGPVVRAGLYTWTETNISPCLSHRVRLWVHSRQGTQHSFTWPGEVAGANISTMVASSYRPAAPASLETVETLYAVVVSWAPSPCAQSYLLSYRKMSGGEVTTRDLPASPRPSLLLTTNIQPCAEYEVKVVAALAETYSQETVKMLTTAPLSSAADQLEIQVKAGRDSVMVSWSPVRDLPCVSQYSLALCEQDGDCLDTRIVNIDQRQTDRQILYSANNSLSECSSYVIKILPIYSTKKMRGKLVPFQTLFPPLTNFARQLGEVDVRLLAGPAVSLAWAEVRCASLYEIVSIQGERGEASLVNITASPHIILPLNHCQQYQLGIRTVLGADTRSEVVALRTIVTEIENPEYYILPNFTVESELETAVISWDHRTCIQSYRVKLCQENDSDKICFEKQLIPTAKKRIQTIMSQLKMCSVYSLDVFPLYNNSEIKTKTTQLRTKSSVQNPKNVKLSLDSVKDKVNIQWDSVKCANNYKIFQKLSSPASSHSSKGSEWTYLTNKVKARLNSPEPCSLVSFGVSALFPDQESLAPEWFQLSIPPKFSSAHFPVLTIRNHLNLSSSTFIIEGSSRFSNCKVAVYQIRKEGWKKVSTFKTSSSGKINVEMPNKKTNLEMRVKYQGFDGWSQWQWVASDALRSEYQTDEQLHTTLFILLGCFLLVVVWLLLITLAVLCRRQRNKKEAESEERCEAEPLDPGQPGLVVMKEEKEEAKNYISEPPDVIQPVKLWYV